jgi:hypothetical protein
MDFSLLSYFFVFKGLFLSKTVCNILSSIPISSAGGTFLLAPASILYSSGILIGSISQDKKMKILPILGYGFLGGAFVLHGCFLAVKPSASFYDTAILAAWMTILFGLLFALVFKKDNLLFSAQLFSAALCLIVCVCHIQDMGLEKYIFSGIQTLGFALLLCAGAVGHLMLILKKRIELLHHFLYWGSFFLGVSALLEALGTHNSSQTWALIFYLGLIHLSFFKFCDEFKLAFGACAGWIVLLWGWPGSAIILAELILIGLWKRKLIYNVDVSRAGSNSIK